MSSSDMVAIQVLQRELEHIQLTIIGLDHNNYDSMDEFDNKFCELAEIENYFRDRIKELKAQ